MWRGICWLALVVALALVGCGGGGDVMQETDNSAQDFSGEKRRAAQVVEDFSAAVAAGDWAKICDKLYTETEVELTAGLLGDSCESESERSFSGNRELNLTVERVEVRGTLVSGADALVFSTDDEGNNQTFTIVDEAGLKIDGYGGTFGADE